MAEPRPPLLVPPRGGGGIGDYSLRTFAANWLMQQDDLAEIGRYRDANAALTESDDRRERVVLIGDSITEFWGDAGDLSGPGWRTINRGIAGQNSSQMLLRFEDDVVALSPRAAVLLCGTNDLRCYVGDPAAIGDEALARIRRNITAMADIAQARGIALILATLPPVGCQPDVHRDPAAVRATNRWILAFAADRGLIVADYHDALVDADGWLPPDVSGDGVHPSEAGYRRMMVRLRAALASAGHRTNEIDG